MRDGLLDTKVFIELKAQGVTVPDPLPVD